MKNIINFKIFLKLILLKNQQLRHTRLTVFCKFCSVLLRDILMFNGLKNHGPISLWNFCPLSVPATSNNRIVTAISVLGGLAVMKLTQIARDQGSISHSGTYFFQIANQDFFDSL